MTEPNYKELSAELYDAFKETFGNKTERQIAILEKYEKLHKPKLTYVSCIAVEDGEIAEDLFTAYREWEKTQ